MPISPPSDLDDPLDDDIKVGLRSEEKSELGFERRLGY
jgi:hypothetical protein